jgi:hypothetical protein
VNTPKEATGLYHKTGRKNVSPRHHLDFGITFTGIEALPQAANCSAAADHRQAGG